MKSAKIVVAAVSLVILAGCVEIQVTVAPSDKFKETMRVAVLDFDWEPPSGKLQQGAQMVSGKNAGQGVAEAFSNRLLDIPGFEVIERSKLRQLLAERNLNQTELVRQGRYEEIGKLLGVDYVVVGTVGAYNHWAYYFNFGSVVSFTCRCVDVRTSKVMWGFMAENSMRSMDPAVPLAAILNEGIPKLRRLVEAQRGGK